MNPQNRLARVREKLAAEGVDAIAVTDPANVSWVTGLEGVFDGTGGNVAFVTAETATLIAGPLYAEAAREAAVREGDIWQITPAEKGALLPQGVAAVATEAGATSVAIEDTLTHRRYESFTKELGDAAVSTRDWFVGLRAIKEPAEIERIAAAQAVTDAAFEHILGFICPGVTEADIAVELEFFMRKAGARELAFASIVASGPNSAHPHASYTSREVRTGDFLKMDFGARVDDYCSDMTRTVVVGQADEHQRELYAAVLSANLAGIEAVRAGAVCSDVDAAARSVLAEAGMEELFIHGLGHGVGLEVHEEPVVGRESRSVLEPGHVITIEPGVYEPGFGGVRIEDLVVVEECGARVLTTSPKELIEL